MSNIRSKAQEIQAAGVAERSNFTPGGVPKRLYQYWLNNTHTKNGRAIRVGDRRENFCHFWRVVMIWAPLMSLVRGFVRLVENSAFQAACSVALVIGLVFGAVASSDFLSYLGIILGGLVSATILMLVLIGANYLIEEYWKERWTPVLLKVALNVFAFVIVAMSFFALYSWVQATSLVLVVSVVVAGVALGFTVAYFGSKLATYLAGQRAIRKAAQDARREAYINGDLTADEYFGKPHTPNAFERRMSAIFSGIGDFIILIAQVVRVKKWKICPLVEVDSGHKV